MITSCWQLFVGFSCLSLPKLKSSAPILNKIVFASLTLAGADTKHSKQLLFIIRFQYSFSKNKHECDNIRKNYLIILQKRKLKKSRISTNMFERSYFFLFLIRLMTAKSWPSHNLHLIFFFFFAQQAARVMVKPVSAEGRYKKSCLWNREKNN